MPRPLRFEYEGALYHVINRGNYRSWIFEHDDSKEAFESCLFEACERCGWVLHAYCVMSNHFHLALETPRGNLSEGMKWLQGVFAVRYNRYRNERGHLFQGRYKSILVEDWEKLAWLCHYIHLNPVRAGITEVQRLSDYRFSSYRFLGSKKGRPRILDFGACLNGAGELKDTAAGRRKYREYLCWLVEDEPRQKDMLFDRMSKGWAHGTKDFKKALLKESEKERAQLELGGTSNAEARELVWETDLERCLDALGKTLSDVNLDKKSADWKVAICAWMRERHLCRNRWLSERLSVGVEAAVCRYVKQLKEGDRPGGNRMYKLLIAIIKY
jgi:putative transposase